MNCARCGEEITAPYFFEGKPFGYTCIKLVNPIAKKKKVGIKEHWVIADSSDFVPNFQKQHVTAYWNGRKFKFWVFPAKTNVNTETYWAASYIELGNSGEVYINLAAFESYPKILESKLQQS